MKNLTLQILSFTLALLLVSCGSDHGHSHNFVLPDGLETIGNSHGDVAVDSQGFLYVSVIGGDKAGIQVYHPNGVYSHNVPDAPNDFHGFVINKENGQEYIYGAGMVKQNIVKLDLKGKVILNISGDLIPVKYKKKNKKNPKAKPSMRLTSTLVAPNGDIYTVDGYGLDYIHQFDKTGKYLKTFGGKAAPYNFSNFHNISLDTRYSPPRILGCNRRKNSLVHLKLNGELIGDYAKDLRRPSSLTFYKDKVAVAEISGRVTELDKDGKIINVVSVNEKQKGGNKWKPEVWKDGIVHSPHGIVYDADGNIYLTEFNAYGRIHRFAIK